MAVFENAALWILVGLVLYAVVYRTYSKWYDRNVMQADPNRPTPAHTYMDGVEFFPTNKYVLMGFHSKTVTALGPVVGPIIALQWGWVPALLWILIGNTLIGWLQDYSAIMVSVKSDGASFGPMAYQLISPRSRNILLVFLIFYLILIAAAFTAIIAPVFIDFPSVAIPVLAFATVGPLTGYMIYRWRQNVLFATVLALILLAAAVGGGMALPFKLPIPDPLVVKEFWISMILLFAFVGAVLPIWKFLQPVNYLLFYLVSFGLLALVLGTFISLPTINVAPFVAFFDPNLTPAGPLWPILFVTIACGAISGWHGLIGSSLSAKQLDYETDARPVGGAMMHYEGIIGITALVAAAILIPAEAAGVGPLGRYVLGGSKLMGSLGFPADVGKAYFGLMGIVLAIAVMQATVRIARFVLSELVGGWVRPLRNAYVSAALFSIPVLFLATDRFGATWIFIWVLFGGSNQLLAALGLLLITLWLVANKRPSIFAGLPMVFMAATTIGALTWASYATLSSALALAASDPLRASGNVVAGILGVALIVAASIMIAEGLKAYFRLKGASVGPPTTMPKAMASVDRDLQSNQGLSK